MPCLVTLLWNEPDPGDAWAVAMTPTINASGNAPWGTVEVGQPGDAFTVQVDTDQGQPVLFHAYRVDPDTCDVVGEARHIRLDGVACSSSVQIDDLVPLTAGCLTVLVPPV